MKWRTDREPALAARVPLLLLLSGCALVLGCSSPDSAPVRTSQAAERSELGPIPEPNLEPLEPAVRQALLEARTALDRQLREDSDGAGLGGSYGELGMLYFAHLLLEPAEAAFQNAETLDAEDFRWPYYLGRLYRMRNDPAAARASLGRALTLDPTDSLTLIALGELQLAERRPDEAAAHFRKALELDASAAPALVGLGKVAASKGDFAQAIERFEAALAIQPEAAAVHYPLGMAHRALGDLERARAHLAQRGERPASLPDPLMDEVRALATGGRSHLLRAGQALEAGRLDQGLEELQRAVAADPNDATSRVTLGALLAQQGDLEAAKQHFVAALRLEPGYAKAHYNLGLTLAGESDDLRAIEHFQQALESDPGHERSAFQLAETLARAGSDREAVEAYSRYIELAPDDESSRLRQALLLVRLGADAEARSRLEAGVSQLPDSRPLAHALARLLATSTDAAVRDGRRALDLATEVANAGGLFEGNVNLDYGETLAMAYAELGQFDRAIALQQAMLTAAERDQRADRLPQLRSNLSRYRNGQACRKPWPKEDPISGQPAAPDDRR